MALVGYLAVLAAVRLVTVARGSPDLFDREESVAFFVMVPLTVVFTYSLVVFTYGFSANLVAPQSLYPARMLALPVSTAALAGWPMLFGALVTAILWFGIRLLVPWPSWLDVPLYWPALLAASLIAWSQALVWMPYGLPGLRLAVTVVWLVVIDVVVLLADYLKAPEPVMLALLAPQVPLAYLLARFAVSQARRGIVPDWRGALSRLGRLVALRTPAPGRAQWASPGQAQAWFEWRQHGRSLPTWVGILLPFELALLFVAGDSAPLIFVILLGALLIPPFMAAFVGASVGRSSTPSFVATRPMTGAGLIAAKLRATMRSTLLAWLLVLVAIPAALLLSDAWPVVMDRGRRAAAFMGLSRTIVLAGLVVAGCVASTWKQLVQTLYLGLTGRDWIVRTSVFLTLSLLVALGPAIDWFSGSRRAQAAIWDAIPALLAVIASLKMGAATWAAVRLYQSRLLSDRSLVLGAAGWCVTVLLLYGVLAWFVSSPLFPRYVLMLVAILAVPLTRLSATPLALAWSRHR
jgi:hypothetical protein